MVTATTLGGPDRTGSRSHTCVPGHMAMFSGELADGSGRTATQSVHGSSRRMRGPAPATHTPQVPARRRRSPSPSSVAATEAAGEIAAGKAGQGGVEGLIGCHRSRLRRSWGCDCASGRRWV